VRLIHRRERPNPLAESEAYEQSYGEHVLDHVDVIHLEPTHVHAAPPPADAGDREHHVTTERLKRQFEERLAGRRRRRRPH
jgi:hypothetical protein